MTFVFFRESCLLILHILNIMFTILFSFNNRHSFLRTHQISPSFKLIILLYIVALLRLKYIELVDNEKETNA